MLLKKNPNETNYVGGRKHWLDVIKNQSDGELLVWRAPEEDFNTNSTLIVMPGESAVFIKSGNIEHVFSEGTYKLNTQNYPFVSRLVTAFSGGISTFNCVVYFVRIAHTKEIPWGFSLQIRDPKLNIATRLMCRGAYKIQVKDPPKFLTKLVGNHVSAFTQESIPDFFRSELTQYIKAAIGDYIKTAKEEILGIETKQTEISQILLPQLREIFIEYGLHLVVFSIEGLEAPEDDPNRSRLEAAYATKAEASIYGDEYGKFVQREVLNKLAENPSGAAGASMAGIGMGIGVAPTMETLATDLFTAPDKNPLEVIKQLKELLDLGAITAAEFDSKKREILNRI